MESKTKSHPCAAEWVLRIAVFGEFVGHGTLALMGKEQWIGWIEQVLSVSPETAGTLLFLIGLMDVLIAITALFYPFRLMLFWAAFWGLFTASVRPFIGAHFLDFVERWPNWGAPLALALIQGMPDCGKAWLAVYNKKSSTNVEKNMASEQS